MPFKQGIKTFDMKYLWGVLWYGVSIEKRI